MSSSTFDEFIDNCTKQFNELSISNTSSSSVQDVDNTPSDKIDQLLETLRSVHSKEPTNVEPTNETKIIPSDFILSAPLSDKHLKWFELTQKVLIHKCETLLNQTSNTSLQSSSSSSSLNEIQDFILHELAPLHEWMKRKCLSIMSNEKIAPQQRIQVQENYLKKSMNDWEVLVGPLLEKLSNLMMEQEYKTEMKALLKEGQDVISIKYKNKEEGKTVCLNVDKANSGQLLFKEEPLCSQVITDSSENSFYSKIDYCHHCMKTIFSEKTIHQFPFIGLLMKDEECKEILSEKLTTAKTFVACKHCSLVTYCCDSCREKSWNQYHSVLCSRNCVTPTNSTTSNSSGNANSNTGKTTDHPITLLERLTIKQHRTAPLLIAKIMATVFTDFIRSLLGSIKDLDSSLQNESPSEDVFLVAFSKSLHRFERFVQHEEPHPFDALAAQLIKESIEYAIQDGYFAECTTSSEDAEYLKTNSQQISQILTVLCNVKQYRSLHGLILQNCSTIHPITELHLAAHEKVQIRNKVCELLHCKNFEEEATRTETLKSLSMKGMGAFAIHNCMNHSCNPNAVSVSDYITHQVSVYAAASSNSSVTGSSSSITPSTDSNSSSGNNSTTTTTTSNTTDSTAVLSKGDEILISYIDEYLPTDERKKKLKEQYRFDCNCSKCTSK